MSELTRRGFFGRLAAVAAGAVVAAKANPARPCLTIDRLPNLRWVEQYNAQFDMPSRLDVLYGHGTLRPEFAQREWTA